MKKKDSLVVFRKIEVRRKWHNEEWYFSIIDIIRALTGSARPRKYWSDLKVKLCNEGFEVSDFIGQLKMPSDDGKMRLTDCVNTENAFRLIQSIPSKKAEPFKRWLARVGYEHIREIENPELAQKRTRELYRAKGYSDEWIEKRMRGIAVRDELVEEWDKRGVETSIEYAILTSEISKATFGLTPKEYMDLKNLKGESLRDHMTDLELIFTMLGEASTTEIARNKDAQGFPENKEAAQKGGTIAGEARIRLVEESGKPVITDENYLEKPEAVKRIERKKRLGK